MFTRQILFVGLSLSCALTARAADLSGGMMRALPVAAGKAPVIDGDLRDFDLRGGEPMWMLPATVEQYSAQIGLLYDDQALYIGGRVALPNRPMRNPNSPIDAFWWGDLVQLRLIADPSTAFPGDKDALKNNERVFHLSLWKNTQTGQDYLDLNSGVNFDKGEVVNPPGTSVKIVQHGTSDYTLEARIPWSALRAPGGRNPFRAGQKMTGIIEAGWGDNTYRVAGVYRQNPGVFAFGQPDKWGQIEFASPGEAITPRPSPLQAVRALTSEASPAQGATGVPIELNLPAPAKVSVNILGPRGEVLRELIGGKALPKGKTTLFWDGRDQWGAALPPGRYRFGAYSHDGLRAEYFGSVGTSGNPPYDTPDGRGAWGGDHGPPMDCAADATGLYFLWYSAEQGRALVKTDYQGRVLWRKTPFVGGGFGSFITVAANGQNVFLILGENKPQLVKLDAGTGQLLTWGDDAKATTISISAADAPRVPDESVPLKSAETAGLAASADEVFVPVASQNKIRVLDARTGNTKRELDAPEPRGVALDPSGRRLFFVSYHPDDMIGARRAQIMSMNLDGGDRKLVVAANLVAPWDVAVDARGRLYVSDLGPNQQIKTFSPDGALLRTMGAPGGRPRVGRYDGNSFLLPAGLFVDARGELLVSESAPPRVMSRFDAASGTLLNRWFGPGSYATTNVPDPDNPRTQFYSIGYEGFARATIPAKGGIGTPDAVYDPVAAGIEGFANLLDTMNMPQVTRLSNGVKYLISDSQPHGIARLEGDTLQPVGRARVLDFDAEGAGVELWSDRNGDGHIDASELTGVTKLRDGTPMPRLASEIGSMWMNPRGDIFLVSGANSVIRIPARGFLKNGAIEWDAARAETAIPEVLPGAKALFTSQRYGILGVRQAQSGDFYAIFSAQDAPYATPELTRQMREGLGWTALVDAVKVAHYAPNGQLLWMAGRKATGVANEGEMYHHWGMGELVGDPKAPYLAACSEWGNITFYTHDGFYVDTLFDVAGRGGRGGPYAFGGETFSGTTHDYGGKVWAYSVGHAYQVEGFENGHVRGERRWNGEVLLDRVYNTQTTQRDESPLGIARWNGGNALDDATWNAVPARQILRDNAKLATVQLAQDAQALHARFVVSDPTPLQNAADTPLLAFKWGDAVALDLGPQGERGDNETRLGDVRLIAARVGGRDVLVALKPRTGGGKRPNEYTSPVGRAAFEFAGEVPGAQVQLRPIAGGYEAIWSVPRSFLELDLSPGQTVRADAEVLLSGAGARGTQVVERRFLFHPRTSQTTMTDDIPTEARLYPSGWGSAAVQ